jgi:hypothetical protein
MTNQPLSVIVITIIITTFTATTSSAATRWSTTGSGRYSSAQIHSRSFAPLLRGETDTHREYAIYGYNNKRVGITAGGWTLLRPHDADAAPPALYTHNVQQGLAFGMGQRSERARRWPNLAAGNYIPGAEMPVWRMTWPVDWARDQGQVRDLLFHNPSDPGQERSLAAERPDQVERLVELLAAHTRAIGAPEEALRRLHLS